MPWPPVTHQDVVDRVELTVQSTKTAAYTVVLADGGTLIEMNTAAAVALTIPTEASVAFPIGTTIGVRQYGAGVLTLTPASGVTLRSRDSALRTGGLYAEAALTKRAANEWVAAGDLVV